MRSQRGISAERIRWTELLLQYVWYRFVCGRLTIH